MQDKSADEVYRKALIEHISVLSIIAVAGTVLAFLTFCIEPTTYPSLLNGLLPIAKVFSIGFPFALFCAAALHPAKLRHLRFLKYKSRKV